jgi:hypothetical protein
MAFASAPAQPSSAQEPLRRLTRLTLLGSWNNWVSRSWSPPTSLIADSFVLPDPALADGTAELRDPAARAIAVA